MSTIGASFRDFAILSPDRSARSASAVHKGKLRRAVSRHEEASVSDRA
ncbi:MAG: hypothetical protein AVDCRST_MAG27-4093 [uncultured Craurococcus sp.]|uniref:Uncharacterized protein n=1 Tax=uncultured Craurococcus sp. TaxID=1135998 RepID=A0A6J4JPK1_9PROT|nr:MAG: hypothetical protein AVDCRST_MAG27-4093 [uncultured Craurococcus sp.]